MTSATPAVFGLLVPGAAVTVLNPSLHLLLRLWAILFSVRFPSISTSIPAKTYIGSLQQIENEAFRKHVDVRFGSFSCNLSIVLYLTNNSQHTSKCKVSQYVHYWDVLNNKSVYVYRDPRFAWQLFTCP